jgi:hypothetical protein
MRRNRIGHGFTDAELDQTREMVTRVIERAEAHVMNPWSGSKVVSRRGTGAFAPASNSEGRRLSM